MRCAVLLLALTLIVPACGGDTPTAPTPSVPQIPQVAGTYTGSLQFSAPVLDFTVAIPANMTVVQAGSQLTITGTITVDGTPSEIPAITGTVNATGFFTATGGGSSLGEDDPTCGTLTPTAFTITFSGNTLRWVEQVGTSLCGNVELSGTLTR